jgi:DNA processing protein
MSPAQRDARQRGACSSCLRRSWLLSSLCGPLDCCARDRGRLIELLALSDRRLLRAVAGTRVGDLRHAYERFDAGACRRGDGVQTTCPHCRGYPPALGDAKAPCALEVAGGAERLARLTSVPVVAILGSSAASDYGMEMARSLARGLAASGVTVVASLSDGIAIAAHAGALDASRGSVAVMGGGLGVACPARRRSLYRRITHGGCAVSELPWECNGRRWGQLASEQTVVGLAQLSVLVEAEDTAGGLAAASIARALGREVAAIPGRVTSPLSHGPHVLLREGAHLVAGPGDVLELLYAIDGYTDGAGAPGPLGDLDPCAGLESGLRSTLERVGAGCETPDALAQPGENAEEVLLRLSELELLGLLARGDGGRYLPRQPLPAHRQCASRDNRAREPRGSPGSPA